MHIVIVGAGVIGVTSAYYLACAGYDVTVVDRADQVAAGASYANGGQLSYSFTDALANPAFVKKIPRFLLGLDPAVKISHPFNPDLLKWAVSFLKQCTSKRAHQNTIKVLTLALRSSAKLEKLQRDVTLDFSYRRAGKLVLIRDNYSLDKAARSCHTKREHGCKTGVLSIEQACVLEPALAHMPGPYAGAVYSENDEVADARVFTEKLSQWLIAHRNVTFEMGQDVQSLIFRDNKIEGVRCNGHDIAGDAVVVCAGAWTERLLAPCGLTANIYPVRGYSVTLPCGPNAPHVSLTDYEHKIVFSRLTNQLRVAGFADFAGFSSKSDNQRIARLIEIARNIAPDGANFDAADSNSWGGLRPMTPDGQPRVGATSVKNLFLNTGHGMFGWTLACATGYDLATSLSEYYAHK